MNTLEEAFLQSAAASLVVEDTAQAKAGAAAKGAAQGFVGLPGDIIALARGVYELGRSGGDIDAFVAGLESKTGLPTTEDVKKFLDEAGLKMGTGESPAETVGEVAAPGGYVAGAKKAARAVKKMTGAK